MTVWVAEWSALQTDKRGDSSSIPANINTFFFQESRISNNIACRFEVTLILHEIKFVLIKNL